MSTASARKVPSDVTESVPVALMMLVWRTVVAAARFVWRTCREAVWVLRAVPRLVAVLALIAVVGVVAGQVVAGFSSGVALLLLLVALPHHAPTKTTLDGFQLGWWYQRVWRGKCIAAGLARRSGVDHQAVPELVHVAVSGGVARVTVRLVNGFTLRALERASTELQTVFNAHALQVAPGDCPDRAVLIVTHVNHLAEETITPVPSAAVDLGAVEIGRELDGSPWLLDIRVHTLVAGCTGAGKGSIMWSAVIGMAPLVKAGHLRLIGIDLKRGLELTMGENLFTTLATTGEAAVAVLEREVQLMEKRCDTLAGAFRKNTGDSPRTVIVIDEAAALQLLITDRGLARRCENAMKLLLTQGRAPGWTMLAFLQDPRRDSFPYRDLFPVGVALRLRTENETAMILGDLGSVPPAHHISPQTPGAGFLVGEGGAVRQVRGHFAHDDLIRHIAEHFAPPHTEPVPELAPDPTTAPRARRQPRTPRTRTNGDRS